jgi:hypothetical protein
MNNFKTYGFTYEYNGREYAFDVTASSPDEAKGRVSAMANATYDGELVLVDAQYLDSLAEETVTASNS